MSKIYRLLAVMLAAVMLAGAALAEPVEAAQVQGHLVISNITVTMNDEENVLGPSLHMGFAQDAQAGSGAVEFYAETGEGKLLPVYAAFAQDDGAVVYFENAATGVRVPMSAIQEAMGQMLGGMDPENLDYQALADMLADGDEDAAFVIGELLPAYVDMVKALMDPEAQAAVRQAMMEALAAELIPEEGEDAQFEFKDVVYQGKTVKCSLTLEQMLNAEVAAMQAVPEAAKFWETYEGFMLKTLAESGIEGVESIADLFEKMGLSVVMDMSVTAPESGEAAFVDMAVTVSKAEGAEGELAEQIPDFEPIVVYTTVFAAGEEVSSLTHFDYTMDGQSMNMYLSAEQTAEGEHMMMNMGLFDEESGEPFLSIDCNMSQTEAGYEGFVNYAIGTQASLVISSEGEAQENGAMAGRVAFDFTSGEQAVSLGFDYALDAEPVEPADLSDAQLYEIKSLNDAENLGSDSEFVSALMKISGSMTSDVGKLAQDEGVQALISMIQNLSFTPAVTVDDDEYDYEYDYEYEEPEDDGELPFDMPELTYIPEGWEMDDTMVDTAYDSVVFSLVRPDSYDLITIFFNADEDWLQSEVYTLGEDGALTPVDGRKVTVETSDLDGETRSLSCSFAENGRRVDLHIYSNDLTLDDLGRLINGIR